MPQEILAPHWQPSTEVVDHKGQAINKEQVFFRTPTDEIGEVLTAHSTLIVGQKPNLTHRLIVSFLAALPFLALGFVSYENRVGTNQASIDNNWFDLGIACFFLCYFLQKSKWVCSYTGTDGIARYTLKKTPNAKPISEIFLFRDAVSLKTGSTNHSINFIYNGTTWFFSWIDAKDSEVFRFHGEHSKKNKTPKGDNLYCYASAAERAWSSYKLPWFHNELKANGYVPFSYNGKNMVRVGHGFMEFVEKGQAFRITQNEIKKMNVRSGVFEIQHEDSHWFSGKGKFYFSYASLTNARLFLYALDQLIGYRFK